MKKELTTQSKKALQTQTPEQMRERIFKMDVVGSPNSALQELVNGLWSSYQNGSPKDREKLEAEMQKQVSAVMYAFEVDTQMAMMESFGERFRGSAKEVCKQFICDFDCKSNTEKIMAETAAIAFMRYLDASRRFNNCLEASTDLSAAKTAFLAMLSKERDRAHRQYLSTVLTLKQMKSPTLEMNIRTKNTFIAQNQQVNTSGSLGLTNTENNEAN